METHEHEVPDEDLPGYGIFDVDYIREGLRRQEEAGLILWSEEHGHFHPAAGAIMVQVGASIMARAASIDPEADAEAITREIVGCLPWAEGVTAIPHDELPDNFVPGVGFVVGPDGETTGAPGSFEVPDTFPDDWAGGNEES